VSDREGGDLFTQGIEDLMENEMRAERITVNDKTYEMR